MNFRTLASVLHSKPLARCLSNFFHLGAKSLLFCIFLLALTTMNYAKASALSLAEITQEMFLGSWVGFAENGITFYRLELFENGKGLCSVVYKENPPLLYKIVRWKLENTEVNIDLTPLDINASPMGIVATHEGPDIKVRIFGLDGSWMNHGTLVSLNKLMKAIEATGKRVSKVQPKK